MFPDVIFAQLQVNEALSPPAVAADPAASARRFFRGEWLAGGGSIGLEIVLVASTSLLLGWLISVLVMRLLRRNPTIAARLHEASSGLGIRRSLAFLLGSILFETIVFVLGLTEISERNAERWILFVRILALGWLASVAFCAALDYAERHGAIQGEKQRKILLPFARKSGIVVILCLASVSALGVIGTNVWGMVAGLGIGGIALAFAAKDSVENVFGSFTVILDMPFGVGDWIRVGTVEGVVEEINLRSTRIRTFEDSLITLPNSNFIKASVENLGQRRTRRMKTTFTFMVPDSIDAVTRFCDALKEFVVAMPETQDDSVHVSLFEIRETGAVVQLLARFTVDSYVEELTCRQLVLDQAMRIAEQGSLEFRGLKHP